MESNNQNPQDQASDTTQPNQSVGDDDFAATVRARRVELGIAVDEPTPLSKVVATVVARSAPDVDAAEREERRERERLAWQKQVRIQQRNDKWRALVSARGERYADCRLSNFESRCGEQSIAVELLTDYCDNLSDRLAAGVNVVLIGPAGTGKDHLLTALCHAAIKEFRNVIWQNGTSLWLSFREAIGREESEATIVRRLASPDVLAISDPVPPRGPLSDYQAAMLFDVIDSRYSRRRATWVTLNCASRQEAEDRLGVQVIDRLSHDALVVKCNWPSYRRGAT